MLEDARALGLAGALFVFSGATASAADFNEPSLYLSEADSPYLASNGGPFTLASPDFHLEDFEDSALDTPGVSGNGQIWNVATTDSVDGDDGVIDGSGSDGISYALITNIDPFIEFSFNPVFDSAFPSHVGLVWTDGDPNVAPVPVTFEAWDETGTTLGVKQADLGDGTNAGTTAEDRFFGVFHAPGISRVRITNNENNPNFGIEVDHLQYGRAVFSVPALSPLVLGLVAAAMTTFSCRRLL